MWTILQAFFWISGFLIVYSYYLYPLLLRTAAKGKSLIVATHIHQPKVAVLMAAYNEEAVIEEKIRSVFETNYPLSQLEMWIGNDASSDNTTQIIKHLQNEYPALKLIDFGGRTGKPQIINQLTEKTQADILILTDANIIFEPTTIPYLVRHFQDEKVGLVAANIKSKQTQISGISVQEDAYIQREIMMKYQQTLLSKVVIAPFGACYAIRSQLYSPVPLQFNVDDFYISMKILEKGFYAIQELTALGWEDISNQMHEEYRRKVRISKGNFQNLAVFRRWAVAPFSRLGFHFISHKVIRWLTPFLMMLALITNALLVFYSSFYSILLALQLFVYLIPLFDFMLKKRNIHLKLFRFVTYFLNMNLALFQGFLLYLKGVNTNIWEPTKRNQ